ncbi:peptide chain release factor N(5)-glutamine methyltransferase [Bacillaceae bacterium IKA-2]|nr:peptide chain release factor N(5)-glutamine methyltransferase [Bacillaceae bacterium IKA-2]
MKIYEALSWASSFLTEHGQEQPIAEILLKHYLGVNRTKLLQQLQDELPKEIEEKIKEALNKVVKGVPVQYITGLEYFYGRPFSVNQDVLIPRPETEELVEGLLKRINQHFSHLEMINVVDVGTGSGAIAITLALENRKLNVMTIDISAKALKVAQHNAEQLAAELCFFEGDLLEPILKINKTVDVIVSNPPYISEADFKVLAENVRDHEPSLALIGGVSGYELYERLLSQIPSAINKRAIIAFEVGVGQSNQVEKLIKSRFPESVTEIVHDINGKDRIVFATLS